MKKKNIKKLKIKKNELPESVQERIKQSKRSRGINTENSETSIGEALKTVLSNLQPPNTDQQNNTES